MRDAAFSRQRYWGEPFPIKWINGIAYPLDESELPLTLPEVDKYKPGPDGEGPLANIEDWVNQKVKLAATEALRTLLQRAGRPWKPTQCPVMPVAVGISCAIWIRIMIKHFVIAKFLITGTRWIYISVVQNMQ